LRLLHAREGELRQVKTVAFPIHHTRSTLKHIFLTIHEDPDFLSKALSTGTLGYVVKSRLASDFIHAIHEALADRTFVSSFQSTEGKG
jgi:DNA-binding NarL/FixJ family response regulator